MLAPDTAHTHRSCLGWHGSTKPILFNLFNLVTYKLYIIVIFRLLCGQMMLPLFNIFNLVRHELYMVVIFGFYAVQIYRPARRNEDTECFRAGAGSLFLLFRPARHDQKNLGLLDSNPFGFKYGPT